MYKKNVTCGKCSHRFSSKNSYWDESGYGYSTRLVRCPECGSEVVVEYVEDYSLDVNNDVRFYEYGRS